MRNAADPLRAILSRLAVPAGWPRVRSFAVMLMLAAQMALGIHQFQHHASLDIDNENHCALCQVASGQDTSGTPPAVVLPSQTAFYPVDYFPAERAPHRRPVVADYQSRAPPLSVSI